MSNNELSFEQAQDQLEQLINKLQNDDIGLEQSLKMYEEGVKLSQVCTQKLKDAEQQIKILDKNNQEQDFVDRNNQEHSATQKQQNNIPF
ncbi:MAG: exodeoxyribonuclease VII small subunit [Gammaproteobacteria bacterium]|nr:MAG: exodeoxyribonuclease VII small subunit [Gammaproteobacteria bacterium]